MINPGVDVEINLRFNPCSDDRARGAADDGGMTTTDYLINGLFVLVILRQSRERVLDRRSIVAPFVLMFFLAQMYVHSIPTAGNDLVFVAVLACAGVALGLLSGLATHVRAGADGLALARVGWAAGLLLAAGIGSRMAFAFAVSHGAEPAIRSFSVVHQIGAAAWPVALVAMAVCQVGTRIVTVQLRGRRTTAAWPALATA